MKKKFRLFDMNKPGNGISKAQVLKEDSTDFYGFFRMLKNRFWNLSSLNILFIFVNFPIIFGLLYLSGVFNLETTAPSSALFAPLYGMLQYGESPYLTVLMTTIGADVPLSVPSTATNVFGYLTLLIVFTIGISNAGASCVIRSFLRSEPVFLFSDFFGCIKKNFKQAFILGILDSLFLYVLAFGITTYLFNSGTYVVSVMLFAEILIGLIYLTMRFYMYMLLITFDISILKLLKNSFIFAIVGFKRNICGWIGILLTLAVGFYILFAIPVFGVILPFLITISLLMFISGFAAYPVIKKYMIDPYYNKETKEKITPVDEPIFIDRG